MLLAACEPIDFPGARPSEDQVSAVTLRGGDITIAAPAGYCVDVPNSDLERGFVLMGGCDVLTRGQAFGPVNSGVIVASVSAERADALVSPQALAASYSPSEVLDSDTTEGVSLIHLADGGQEHIPKGEPRNWQGVATVNGYLILMSVYSEQDGTAARASGGDLIVTLAQNIRLNSPFRMLPKPPRLRPV